MKRNVMINNTININKTTVASHLEPFNINKTMTYDVENPGPGLGQAQKYGRVKLVNGISSCHPSHS